MARRITNKERNRAGNIYCSYCRPKKTHATYRFHWDKFACEEHKYKIEKLIENEDMWNNRDQSEAEFLLNF